MTIYIFVKFVNWLCAMIIINEHLIKKMEEGEKKYLYVVFYSFDYTSWFAMFITKPK